MTAKAPPIKRRPRKKRAEEPPNERRREYLLATGRIDLLRKEGYQ